MNTGGRRVTSTVRIQAQPDSSPGPSRVSFRPKWVTACRSSRNAPSSSAAGRSTAPENHQTGRGCRRRCRGDRRNHRGPSQPSTVDGCGDRTRRRPTDNRIHKPKPAPPGVAVGSADRVVRPEPGRGGRPARRCQPQDPVAALTCRWRGRGRQTFAVWSRATDDGVTELTGPWTKPKPSLKGASVQRPAPPKLPNKSKHSWSSAPPRTVPAREHLGELK